MPQKIAELAAVSVRYGEHDALSGIDLQIEQGELFALVGPSGAGKSTLLRVLSGLQAPTSGAVRRPDDDGGATRSVFQYPHLLPWRTVARNVRLGLEYRANGGHWLRGKEAADQRVREVLSDLGIGGLAGRYPAQLSGGQAQRVAVARAVVAGPSLLLLDEPFGALDPLTRADLQDWLRSVHARLGLSTVLVTHDLDEALYLGDRIGLLHTGGRPLEVVTSPVTRREQLTDGSARRELLARFSSPAERAALSGHDGPERGSPTTLGNAKLGNAKLGNAEPESPGAGSAEPGNAETESAGAGAGAGRARTRREALTITGALALLTAPVVGSMLTSGDRAGATATTAGANPGATAGTTAGTTDARAATLRIGYLPITDAAPLLLAHDSGQFGRRGITTPAPVLYRGWAPLVEALQGGNVDIVHLLMPLAIQLRYDAKVPVKVLAWNHANGSALTVAKDVGRVEDLAGTKVAIPAWFSVHNVVLQKLLRKAGITPVLDTVPSARARTTQLVVIPPADMPTALQSGSISGYIVAEPFCAAAEVLGIGKILRFTGDVWKDHACCVTVVREDLVRDRPDVAQRAAEAIIAAQLAIRGDREGSARRLSEGRYLPQPLPALERTFTARPDPAYVSSGAIRHPEWDSRRIDFQPHPYPSYTGELVRAMKETVVDANVAWLDDLDPAEVHGDLVATGISAAALDATGGLTAFGAARVRTEIVEP
ncbi:ABC transporter substrate-binding protein [Nonomuraea zeae]|uniref:ATP-binding cassette domain-containing protein n=1 Tax=Nonomuraea zeae TaxID=1642303 RepID=A0A5S4H277_9ACTN|nr:ABC transporter substrate-binding protein [Nonomuraea zeae]TMR32900.1 ATP-binding cassette domain-containing protein [Nonomuraea zeae]